MPPFLCSICGREHDELPAFHADRPTNYWDVPEEKRETDVFLTSDSCVIADRFFFIRGCLDVPIHGRDEVFTFGVWVSLSETNFFAWQDLYEVESRSHAGPYFGWLCTQLPVYPDTMSLKTLVHLQDHGVRPRIVLERTDHPLALDQHEGISLERAWELVHLLEENAPE